MSDETVAILGVPAAEPPTDEEIAEALQAAEADPGADPLADGLLGPGAQRALGQVLRAEGELVRRLRHTPEQAPTAWRWTDAEIRSLQPVMAEIAERWGVARYLNSASTQIGASAVIALHVTRSLGEEARARRELSAGGDVQVLPPTPTTTETNDAERPSDEPPAEEPRTGLDADARARIARLSRGLLG